MTSTGATLLEGPVSDMHCAAVPVEFKGLTGELDTHLSQISSWLQPLMMTTPSMTTLRR